VNQTYDPTSAFYEEQQFRQPLLWILLLMATVFVTGLFAYAMHSQLYLKQPWGDRPMSDTALIVTSIVSILISAGFTLLFYKLKLITNVRVDGIHIRYFPLVNKVIAFDTINSCKARTYRPIREYGGWGIRFGRNGKAYNVSGNQGVQLEFTNGKSLLIGSQKADKLAAAINKYI